MLCWFDWSSMTDIRVWNVLTNICNNMFGYSLAQSTDNILREKENQPIADKKKTKLQ